MIKTFIRNQRSLFSAICDLFGCSEYDNPWSEEVIAEKKKQKLPCTAELAEAQKLHGQLKRLESETSTWASDRDATLKLLGNVLDPSVPCSDSEEHNEVMAVWPPAELPPCSVLSQQSGPHLLGLEASMMIFSGGLAAMTLTVGYEPLGSIKAWGSKGSGCELLEQPTPKPSAGSCVVRVSAVGLNPTDWKHVGNGMHLVDVAKRMAAKVDLTRLRQWVDQKLLRTEIAEVYSFAEAPKALETLEEGGGHNTQKTKTKAFRGKVVVKVS
eukprot:g2505.t1